MFLKLYLTTFMFQNFLYGFEFLEFKNWTEMDKNVKQVSLRSVEAC